MWADRDIANINKWLKKTKTVPTKLGKLSCSNQSIVQRIRDGKCRLESLRRVTNYIMKNPRGPHV